MPVMRAPSGVVSVGSLSPASGALIATGASTIAHSAMIWLWAGCPGGAANAAIFSESGVLLAVVVVRGDAHERGKEERGMRQARAVM